MKKLIPLLLLTLINPANAKLIDKIAGVINDKVFTLSEVKRIKSTIDIRKEIAPFIFTKNKYSQQDVLRILQHSYIVRDKLEELGFIISDDSVEDRIKETERSLKLNRDDLLVFLASKGITFNEYFEIIRSAMEFNIFNRRIIAPLVTITDQELKNVYYKTDSRAKSSSFNYNVIDFNISVNKIQKSDIKNFPNVLSIYRKTGNLPEIYSSLSTDELGELSNEDIPKSLQKVFRVTSEKSFSRPYISDGTLHVFYLVKKEIADSSDFLEKKRRIYSKLFMTRSSKLSQNWFSRESLKYYVLNNL
jgi:peptidyl-prolyl cis-trans isomerase SurA